MMRDKRRYVMVMSSRPIAGSEQNHFQEEFYSALMKQLGEAEYFKANPKIVKFVGRDSFILKVTLDRYEHSIVAVTFVKSISGKPVGFYTLRSSGTIRALSKPPRAQKRL